MAYSFDIKDNALVISGFEAGIGVSPYAGLGDVKSANISSIPGEVSVNFSMQSVTPPQFTNIPVTGVDTTAPTYIQFSSLSGLENGMAINFTNVGSLTGVSGTAVYWVSNVSSTHCSLSNAYNQSVNITIGGTAGGATFSTYNMGTPKQYAKAKDSSASPIYFMVDNTGYVWTNDKTTTSGYWEFTGNITNTNGTGNGLVYYEVTDGAGTVNGYLFVFRFGLIDYLVTTVGSHNFSWTYGWNPADASTGNTVGYLDETYTSHYALLGPDNRVYFCNGSNIYKFFQTASGTIFNPTSLTSYTHLTFSLLPTNDKSQCLTPLGTNLLIGARGNTVYVWDTTSSLVAGYIYLPESNIIQMVTVNTNAYLFAGNRGNIYITNGSQANVFKKVPDHISNTVEPYFQWGGAIYQKNRLYFGVYAIDNSGNSVEGYAGLWCIDLDSEAIYCSNQLSFGSYGGGGYVSALIGIPAVDNAQPTGIGAFVGWFNGTSGGMDKSISKPYTGTQGYIVSDLIPIGTYNIPQNNTYVEYKLSTPLVSGESITLNYRPWYGTSWVLIGTDSTAGNFTNTFPSTWANLKWIQIQAVLTSTATTPSYVRLKEMRIAGFTGPSFGTQQLLTT